MATTVNKALVAHCGGNVVSLDELYNVKTPTPSNTHFPIAHHTLLEHVKDMLADCGWNVVEERHALAKEGARYFGVLGLAGEHLDRRTLVGLRNSHDRSFSARLALGNQVFVCDNLSFSGSVEIGRKHTTFIERDLPRVVATAVGRLNGFEVDQDARIGLYKTTEITPAQADHALLTACRARVIAPTRIIEVMDEYYKPSHPEFAAEGNTLWRLYNAFTEKLKPNFWDLPKRCEALHAVLDTFCGHQTVIEGELEDTEFAIAM